jgi:hypothetical protein
LPALPIYAASGEKRWLLQPLIETNKPSLIVPWRINFVDGEGDGYFNGACMSSVRIRVENSKGYFDSSAGGAADKKTTPCSIVPRHFLAPENR